MKVYDIINAGPNHRFVVRNRLGQPLLVSNCVQAIAADIMAHGAIVAEQRGMPPFALIHDQGLALRENGHTAEEFAAALADLPVWAKGLPIRVAAHQCDFYSK